MSANGEGWDYEEEIRKHDEFDAWARRREDAFDYFDYYAYYARLFSGDAVTGEQAQP